MNSGPQTVALALVGITAMAEPVPFQFEFGVDLAGPDQGSIIAESANGDVIVAGQAAASY